MNNLRAATTEELQQVMDYEISKGFPVDIDDLRNAFIAVFDDYVMRGYQGKMLVIVDTVGLTNVYIWEDGNIRGLNGKA